MRRRKSLKEQTFKRASKNINLVDIAKYVNMRPDIPFTSMVFNKDFIGMVSCFKNVKTLTSKSYNYRFNIDTGYFERWGETLESDGDLNQGLPEIADIEISTICSAGCKFCYKSNTSNGDNMSYETFVKLFEKLPISITQIAFGIGDLPIHGEGGNPDLWKIFNHCRENYIVPNVTINGFRMCDETADLLSKYCGAVAVSLYDKESTYNTIKMLTDRGMKQINIHYFLSDETYDRAFELFNDVKNDSRLSKLNAIVFLSLKTKGRAKVNNYTPLSIDKFKNLMLTAMEKNIGIGFDSCSAQKALESVKGLPNSDKLEQMIEPCESTLYSMYINTHGEFFPCSFSEGDGEWEKGLNVLECNNFLNDIWWNEKTMKFKQNVIKCRECKKSCSIFEV